MTATIRGDLVGREMRDDPTGSSGSAAAGDAAIQPGRVARSSAPDMLADGVAVRSRIHWAVAATCAAILAFTVGVIAGQRVTVDRGAVMEARNLARAVAYGATAGVQSMQQYVEGLDELYKRDIVIVDAQKKGLADADPKEVGETFDHDPGNEVGQTIADGKPRVFVEKGPEHPEGLAQVTVPLRSNAAAGSPTIGAVILEYSGIRRELWESALWQIHATAAAGLFCALLVGVFGYRLARSISSATRQVAYLAYHDKLTGLHNRSMFVLKLDQGLKDAARHGHRLAVFFVDLDRFKNINDTLGHEAGDHLLKEVSGRFATCLRASDSIARLGGDEFVVMLSGRFDDEHLASVARKILVAVARPIRLCGQEFRVTASVGISVYPGDGVDERSLMKHADIAMYQAKEDGKNNFAFYRAALNQHSIERLAFESSLRHALDQRHFEVHYQPKVDFRTGSIIGFEALLRWNHADLGQVPPTKFIPVAEETGLIVPLGRWVLETACAQHVAWREQGRPPLTMAVNLSARQFGDDHLLDDVRRILRDTRMEPSCLEFEITESMLMHDVERSGQVLRAFRDMGIRLSVDDFGTGYSSLANLRQFPIDTIKVDRSFIRDLAENREDKAIADAIIAMGRTLGMTIVAEGVETREQADFLREHGCDQFQGFLFSKAVSPERIAELIDQETARA